MPQNAIGGVNSQSVLWRVVVIVVVIIMYVVLLCYYYYYTIIQLCLTCFMTVVHNKA